MQVQEDVYEKIDKELLEFVEDVLLNRCDNATERLMCYAATIEAKCKPCAVRKKGVAAVAVGGPVGITWRDSSPAKRLEYVQHCFCFSGYNDEVTPEKKSLSL